MSVWHNQKTKRGCRGGRGTPKPVDNESIPSTGCGSVVAAELERDAYPELKAFLQSRIFMTPRTNVTGSGLVRQGRAFLLEKFKMSEEEMMAIITLAIEEVLPIGSGERRIEQLLGQACYQQAIASANRLADGQVSTPDYAAMGALLGGGFGLTLAAGLVTSSRTAAKIVLGGSLLCAGYGVMRLACAELGRWLPSKQPLPKH